ncbi:phospholipase A [Aestuariibacter sp. AA17]|uniref:Phospholipase A1 n=1 Tax=Fluctibacter corallii TaxID=2984329 RepID=A0ABT3A634_9ALTE|nr:phospholipase A [Aestuariibacter sp. AA17]MCV2884108.1 phospholipase A [Aestuariibacter sp. AA17]
MLRMFGITLSLLAFSSLTEARFADEQSTNTSHASSMTSEDACLLATLASVSDDTPVSYVKSLCEKENESRISKRIHLEKRAASNRFAILPHRPNYIMPVTVADVVKAPYITDDFQLAEADEYHDVETKFQISLKYLAWEDVIFNDLDLLFAFTATSWWQSYNGDISAPFRETNYEPEFIFGYNHRWSLLGLPVEYTYVSLNHQSNGQTGTLSRSWNRLIAGVVLEPTDNITWGLRAWYRFDESAKDGVLDPKGDDNPNIEEYYGYGELSALWHFSERNSLELMLRNNLRKDNKGAIQLGWSFPISDKLFGYVEYFNGYGESLIYYDQHIERLGVGIKLTNWL